MVEEFRGKENHALESPEANQPKVHSIRIPFTRHGGVLGILMALEVAVNPYAAGGNKQILHVI